tara:strand:- start:4088 stop:5386 length:1299 start_codon:yes stop_codon:yes gene_type:complete
MKKLNIGIAGLGNVGSALIKSIEENNNYFKKKTSFEIEIVAVSAKSKNKKRNIDINKYKWFDDPIDIAELHYCDVIVELIGQEKGISYNLIENALKNNKHVVTGNKALIANHGKNLFNLAEINSLALSFEAAVAGGIPIIKTIKNDISFNKINKISGILNGTTNFILTKMEEDNLSFDYVLKIAKDMGFTSDHESKLDIGGYDAAHKLTILSTLAFGSNLNFEQNYIEGIADIKIEDINFAKKLGYRIKLISESSIIENQIFNFTSPKLVSFENPLSNVGEALNAINIETNHLDNLFLEGQGAGGKPTTSSILSDLYDIAQNEKFDNLGFKLANLKNFEKYNSNNIINSYYLRIMTDDKPGVLSSITNNFSDSGISVEKILQLPEMLNNNSPIPIIITTHKIKKEKLGNAINKIEKLDFVKEKITVLPIHDN